MDQQRTSISLREKIKMNMYSFYYSITSEKLRINFIYVLMMTIEFIQKTTLLYFPIAFYSKKNEEEFQEQRQKSTVKLEKYLLKIVNLNIENRIMVSEIILYVFFALFCLQIIVTFTNIKFHNYFLNKLFFSFFFFLQLSLQTFAHIPLLSIFLSFYECYAIENTEKKYLLNYLDDAIECNSVKQIILMIISSMAILLLTIILIFNILLLHNLDPLSNAPFSSAYFDRKIFDLILKVFCSVFLVFNIFSERVKIIIIFCFSVGAFVMRIIIHEHYNRMVQVSYVLYDTALLYHSVSNLIEMNIFHEHSCREIFLNLIASLLIGVFVVVVLYKFQEKATINSLLNDDIKMTIAIKLYKIAKNFKVNNIQRRIFISMLQKHFLQCEKPHCKCSTFIKQLMVYFDKSFAKVNFKRNIGSKEENNQVKLDGHEAHESIETETKEYTKEGSTKNLSDENEDESTKENTAEPKSASLYDPFTLDQALTDDDCIFGFLKILIENSLQRNNKDFYLVIFLCYIMKNHLRNYFKSLFEIMKLKRNKLEFSKEFIIFCLNSDIEEELHTEYSNKNESFLDIEEVLKYNENVTQMIDKMKSTCGLMLLFWTNVSCIKMLKGNARESDERESDLYSIGRKITESLTSMSTIYNKMRYDKKYSNQKIKYLYSLFLFTIVCDEKKAREVDGTERTDFQSQLDNFGCPVKKKKTFSTKNPIKDIFESLDDVGIIIISGQITSIGKIITVNHQACSLLNYDKSELLHENVNKICPSFIGQYHDKFMYRYLETAKKHIINKVRIVFALSKDGLLIPIFIFVKVIPNLSPSVRFIGMVVGLEGNHPFLQTEVLHDDYELKDPKPCFLLCTGNDEIFGTNEVGLKQFGIPLHVLNITNENKINTITIDMLFPQANFYDRGLSKQLRSKAGAVLTLNSKSIRLLFHDYKESTLENSKSGPLKAILKNIKENELFKDHLVLCFFYDLSFNEGEVPSKIIKIVKVKKIKRVQQSKVNGVEISQLKLSRYNSVSDSSNYSSELPLTFKTKPQPQPQQNVKFEGVSSNDALINGEHDLSTTITKAEVENYFSSLKHKIKAKKFPRSICILIATLFLFFLFELLFAVDEFMLSKVAKEKIVNFLSLDTATARRSIYFSGILMYFRVLTLMDNSLIDEAQLDIEIDREGIIEKIMHDVNLLININYGLEKQLQVFKSHLKLQKKHLEALEIIQVGEVYTMEDDYTIVVKSERYHYIMNSVLIKMQKLLLLESIKVDAVNDLFYYNQKMQPKSNPVTNLVLEIFYVNENGIKAIGTFFEKIIQFLESIVEDFSSIYELKLRTYICIPPFFFVAAASVGFFFIFRTIARYKIWLLRIFYLIERKFGVEMLNNCLKFNSVIECTVQGLTFINDYETKNEVDILHNINKVVTLQEQEDSSLFNEPKWIQFWAYDSMDESIAKKIKERKNYIFSELVKSRKSFWKLLYFVYIQFIFLMIALIVYFSVTIYLDLNFEKQGLKERKGSVLFTTRGGILSYMLIFFRESGFNPDEYYNSYSNYSKRIDEKENEILILSSQKRKNSSNSVLFNAISIENELNSDKFCDILSEYDSLYYAMFQESCDEYFEKNNGLRDGIQIIFSYLKNNYQFQDYFSKINTLDDHIQFLSRNISFVTNIQYFIDKAILFEIDIIEDSIIAYGNSYYKQCLIRIWLFSLFTLLEIFVWVYIVIYLVKNLNRDKLILTLIPNKAISVNRNLLITLKKLQ